MDLEPIDPACVRRWTVEEVSGHAFLDVSRFSFLTGERCLDCFDFTAVLLETSSIELEKGEMLRGMGTFR